MIEKKLILVASALVILTASCGQQSSSQQAGSQQLKTGETANAANLNTKQGVIRTQYEYWVCRQGDHAGAVIVFAHRDGVFRGEYLDPGFQDYFSIPVMGTIDDEGNVSGVSATTSSDALHGKLSGNIIGDTFHAVWLPTPTATGEYREMKMTREKPSAEIAAELNRHSDAFYNILYPEKKFVTIEPYTFAVGGQRNRVIPFLPETPYTEIAYGYSIGEWESRHIHVGEGVRQDEAEFHLHIVESGMNETNVYITGFARLDGNTFRYNEKGYQFEVTVYNDFITVKTIAGDLDGVKADGVYPAAFELSYYVNF